ncbi:MAG: efflux RND transporter periplasmic adaptor subunit [Rhodospirillales bacterium]|nr:efflux RND transporter periplasmic adaptor subunit [Rhodospirillales bacterium]
MSARTLLAVALAAAMGVGGGIAYERLNPDPPAASGGKKVLYWVAPMDPNYRRDAPGKSPMGMDLIPVYEGEEAGERAEDPGQITVSPAVMNTIGVRTGTAERVSFGAEIRTVGYVAQDEDRTSHIHVRKEGWIERLVVRSLGAEVKRGDLLFEFFSPELEASSFEYVRDIERGDDWMTSAGRRRLQALGVSDRQIAKIAADRRPADRIRVYAPQDGVVVQLGVGEGMYIRPDQTVMTLTDLSSIWVIADVLESQSGRVFPGMAAEARLSHLPDEVWRGQVDYIYPDLDPATRTLRVRLRFPNPGLQLRPNMFAEVILKGDPRPEVLAVPSEAVIRTGRNDRVVLALGEGRFKPVPVKVGAQFDGLTELLSGIEEGASIVLSGQFLIDSESSIRAGFARMEESGGHEHGPSAKTEVIAGSEDPGLTWGEGEIEAVKEGGAVLALNHEQIPALGWPAMAMEFKLAKDVEASVSAGDRVRFALAKDAEGMFHIVKLEPAAAGAKE